MKPIKIIGVVLILAGFFGLISGGFSFTEETHDAKVGPVEISVKEKNCVSVPVWASAGDVAAGGAMLLLGGRSR
ncbi:MAG: hypothetical protein VB045_05560 [Synergistaceae bacterium]|nr:hypothetical protein [Synergistaceae bacterium]